jgi:hypothetical protein
MLTAFGGVTIKQRICLDRFSPWRVAIPVTGPRLFSTEGIVAFNWRF